jgi:hypothetical protein
VLDFDTNQQEIDLAEDNILERDRDIEVKRSRERETERSRERERDRQRDREREMGLHLEMVFVFVIFELNVETIFNPNFHLQWLGGLSVRLCTSDSLCHLTRG